MAEMVRLQTKITKELKTEITKRSKEMGVSEQSLIVICLRAGLDVIKVSLSADYAKLMELLAKEDEGKEH